jgi:hydroxymethylbilane synthase
MLPSPGQGQLALEYRRQDTFIGELLEPLNHFPSQLALTAERSFMKELGLGCTEPVGAFCSCSPPGYLTMDAVMVDLKKGKTLKTQGIRTEQSLSVAEQMGIDLATGLLDEDMI